MFQKPQEPSFHLQSIVPEEYQVSNCNLFVLFKKKQRRKEILKTSFTRHTKYFCEGKGLGGFKKGGNERLD